MNFAQINSKCATNSQKKAYHDLIINNILHLKAFFLLLLCNYKKKGAYLQARSIKVYISNLLLIHKTLNTQLRSLFKGLFHNLTNCQPAVYR